MINKSINLTAAGKKELEKELESLIAKRPAIAERLATARAFGDLSENQEYTDARSEQKTIENRILEIQDILKNAKTIKNVKHSKVSVGSTVTVKAGSKTFTYSIVSPVEANPLEGKISNESPIGKAIFGLKQGETTNFNGKKYEVISIE